MSAMERVITIGEVKILSSGVTKRGKWTLAGVVDKDDGRTYAAIKDSVRELAEGNIGAEAKALYTEESKDGFTNYRLEGLEILTEATHSPSNGTGDLGHISGIPVSKAAQDEFRRNKVEMRWTEAVHAAALIENAYPDPEGFEMDNFVDFAATIYDLIKNFEEPTEIPFGA